MKANEQMRLLIYDDHDNHITSKWIEYCMNSNIVIMILPSHSSHLTQSLDVAIFNPLNRHMTTKIENGSKSNSEDGMDCDIYRDSQGGIYC